MALLSGATTIDVADLIDDASDDSLDGTSHLIIEDDEEDNDPEAEAEAEPMCDAEEEAEAEVLPIAPPAAPPDAGKEKVAQSKSAELLLSIFPHRPPTIYPQRRFLESFLFMIVNNFQCKLLKMIQERTSLLQHISF